MNRPKSKSKNRPKSAKTAIQKRVPTDLSLPEKMQEVLIAGNLAPLSVPDRMLYYRKVCQSLGLNPLTRPFDYISFQNKVILYARKDCTDQLRRIHGVSIIDSKRTQEGELTVVEVTVRDRTGRTDTGIGAWSTESLKGENLVNGLLKAETKAKRRATLSICGLGMLDASELDTIEYDEVSQTGRVVEIKEAQPENPHLTVYEQREQEALKKLSPAQREILEKKMAAAKAKQDPAPSPDAAAGANVIAGEKTGEAGNAPAIAADYDGLTCTLTNGMYHIDGPTSRLREVRDTLKPYWMKHANPPGIFAKPEDLGKLMRRFEEADVKFRIL